MCCMALFISSLGNSTSRLFAQRRGIQEEPCEEIPKRFASTEGRFSIIDEHSKDSDSSDSDQDSPLPTMVQKQKVVRPNFSKSVDYSHVPGSMSTSRFRIVPVESRYKRGRWNCFDYYDKDAACSRSPKISCPGPSPFKPVAPKNDRSVRSLTEMPLPSTAPPTQAVAFNFDVSSDSDQENAVPAFGNSLRSHPKEKLIIPVKSLPVNNRALNVDCQTTGRMTPTEVLQSTLETTLNTADINMEEAKDVMSTSSNNNGSSPAMVAIDSKIEQAMDLVKTHLMFAVREEVEVLRAKIVDLESHIHHLEAENSVLRDHIPDDILSNLNLGGKSK